MRSLLFNPACVALLAVVVCIPHPVTANPVRSSVWIDVTRDAGAVFNGYRLPREGEGMGVVVLSREVVTAAHVVWGAKTITLMDAKGAKVAAHIEHIDPVVDAAVLRVERQLGHVAAIRLRPSVAGERVVAVQWQRSNGTASTTAGTVWATRWTNHGVAVGTIFTGIKGEKGMSGGGLFDQRGQLIGVIIRIDRTLSYLSVLPVTELCTRFARCAGVLDQSQ